MVNLKVVKLYLYNLETSRKHVCVTEIKLRDVSIDGDQLECIRFIFSIPYCGNKAMSRSKNCTF